ncbi:hypothetical protein CBM2629_B120128 [Cupriavidus taiwanensis]|nr:hypothetical protein CBM2629_B120128 [Cupriavidus taiwanensis]
MGAARGWRDPADRPGPGAPGRPEPVRAGRRGAGRGVGTGLAPPPRRAARRRRAGTGGGPVARPIAAARPGRAHQLPHQSGPFFRRHHCPGRTRLCAALRRLPRHRRTRRRAARRRPGGVAAHAGQPAAGAARRRRAVLACAGRHARPARTVLHAGLPRPAWRRRGLGRDRLHEGAVGGQRQRWQLAGAAATAGDDGPLRRRRAGAPVRMARRAARAAGRGRQRQRAAARRSALPDRAGHARRPPPGAGAALPRRLHRSLRTRLAGARDDLGPGAGTAGRHAVAGRSRRLAACPGHAWPAVVRRRPGLLVGPGGRHATHARTRGRRADGAVAAHRRRAGALRQGRLHSLSRRTGRTDPRAAHLIALPFCYSHCWAWLRLPVTAWRRPPHSLPQKKPYESLNVADCLDFS